jgi:hypothetical protein
VQLDIKPPICFSVVEREEFFTLFSWLVLQFRRCILDHVLDGGVEVIGPVFFHLVGLLFPLVFHKLNFVGFLAHLVVPVCCLDELSDDAFKLLNSLMGWDVLLAGGEDAILMASFCVHLNFFIFWLD